MNPNAIRNRNMEDTVTRERDFHDRRFSNPTQRAQKVSRFYAITDTVRRHYRGALCSQPATTVLEYGCGTGSYAFELARNGARVHAIDISQVALDIAAQRASELDLEDRISLRRMDAHALNFPADTFDLVCGTGILHHLDLDTALSQVARVLRSGGHAVFIEPLGHNPLINQFRKRTPTIRSADEHPLLRSDLALFHRYFATVELDFYYLTALLAALPGLKRVLPLLESLDRQLFKLSFLRPYAWQVLIKLSHPRTEGNTR